MSSHTTKACLAFYLSLVGGVAGCGGREEASPNPPVTSYVYHTNPGQIQFKDSARANVEVAGSLADLQFVDAAGQPVLLKDHLQKKNLVLVITRGVTTPVCVYCATQTSRLVASFDEFSKRDAEILVVYPVDKESNQQHFQEFLTSTRGKLDSPEANVPFTIALDMKLAAVDRLGIRQDLSKPATYILDKQGEVRFAYVGQSAADRPSVKALLTQLDEIQQGER